MPIVNLSPLVRQQFNNNGSPVANGLLFSYAAGTTNKITTYKDYTGTVPNTNPIVLDANGACDVWLDESQAYKLVLSPAGDTDPPTNPLWTRDNLAGSFTPFSPPSFNQNYAIAIGGYPKGAILLAADFSGTWANTVSGNTTNPDTGGAGWTKSAFGGVAAMTFAQVAALTSNQGPIICSDRGGILYEWSGSAYASQAATNADALARTSSAALLTPAALGFAEQPTTTGSAVFTRATNNIQMTGIVAALGLEVGDVIQITGTVSNNFTMTVEVVTDANNIIVNAAHANGSGSLSLTNETATCTIKRIAKNSVAPLGLGQAWVDVTASRAAGVTYTNTTGRAIAVSVTYLQNTTGTSTLLVGPVTIAIGSQANVSGKQQLFGIVPAAGAYALTNVTNSLSGWQELR